MAEAEGSVGGTTLRAVPTADERDTIKVAEETAPKAADERLVARIARADRYFNEHLRDQRGWYSKKASNHKTWSQRLSLAVVGCGALVTFAQAFAAVAPVGVPAVTAALGVAIAVLTGVQRIWKYDETWVAYRRASEQMKREYRLYINGAGPYADLADEDEAYRRFVENTEAILAEEQQIYWQARADGGRQANEGQKPKPEEGTR
jgi:hypothetical protein